MTPEGDEPGPEAAAPRTGPVGARQRVIDATERVTGRVAYVVNERRPAMLHARVLRSTHAHGRLLTVDTSAALTVPGVVAIVTGRDVPGAPGEPRSYGIVTRDTPVLAVDRVRYAGEPLAAVAATDPDAAEEALGRIVVEVEPLPAVLSIEAALDPAAPHIHDGGNRTEPRTLQRGDVDAALAAADVVVTETLTVPPVQGVPLETHSVVAEWDEHGLTVHTATQTPYHVRRELAHVFDMAPEQVRVITRTLGGGFGAKAYPRVEPLAALIARRAGRPVKLVLSRAEEFVTVQRQATTVTMTTAAARDGRLLGLRAECTFGSGAYLDNLPRVLRHGLYSLAGPYRYDALDLVSGGVFTNLPPCGPLRAPGTAQVHWAREAHLDAVADALGIAPLELRRRNLVTSDDSFVLGGPMGDVHLGALLDAVEQPAPPATPKEPGAPGRRTRRGVGYAVALKTTSTPSTSEAIVSVGRGRVGVLTSSVEMGQGARTVLAQIAAEAMSVSVGDVDVSTPDTATTPPDAGTVSSRTTFSMGSAIELAAAEVRDQLLAIAERHLEIARRDLVVADGRVRPIDGSSNGLTFDELVELSGGERIDARATFTNQPMRDPVTDVAGISTHLHQAAASAAVEVDLETGAVEVLELRVATHAGMVVNPTLAELQSEGNATFGLGQALMEEIHFDAGQVQNGSLADYLIPSIADVPARICVELHEDDSREVHGIGETALPAVVPAITNAVARAIGARLPAVPATPERVLRAQRAAVDGRRT